MSEKIEIGPKRKIGFVCSGGATKAGAFHLGVALALKEYGFKFQGRHKNESESPSSPTPMEISTYVGSSAGSVIASYLASGFTIENILNSYVGRTPRKPEDALPRILPKLSYPTMFKLRTEIAREQLGGLGSIGSFLKGMLRGEADLLAKLSLIRAPGIFSTAGIEQFLREEALPLNKFQDLEADLFIVATQLNHSRKVVFGKYSYAPPAHDLTCQYDHNVSISEACAASVAIPFVYAPYVIQGTPYLDGEIRDTLSTHVAIDAGCDLVFASYTHQPYHFQEKFGSLLNRGVSAILIQSLYLLVEQKITQFIYHKKAAKMAVVEVEKLLKSENADPSLTRKVMELLERELQVRRDVNVIYIHPDPEDAELFLMEHFTLTPKKLAHLVRSGFQAGSKAIREYKFKDRVKETIVSEVETK